MLETAGKGLKLILKTVLIYSTALGSLNYPPTSFSVLGSHSGCVRHHPAPSTASFLKHKLGLMQLVYIKHILQRHNSPILVFLHIHEVGATRVSEIGLMFPWRGGCSAGDPQHGCPSHPIQTRLGHPRSAGWSPPAASHQAFPTKFHAKTPDEAFTCHQPSATSAESLLWLVVDALSLSPFVLKTGAAPHARGFSDIGMFIYLSLTC